MGIRSFFRKVGQTHEERLIDEVRDWAAAVPDVTPIQACPERIRARVAGVVRRVTLHALEGRNSVAAEVYDGTGEVTAVWVGRDSIPGLRLGSRLVLEGVMARERGELRMVNPQFDFA